MDTEKKDSDFKIVSGPMWALFAFVFAVTGIAIVVFWL